MTVKSKILIVEDQTINQKNLCKILSDDYDLLTAKNGKEALDILRSESKSISAVLLDLIMPVMDGFTVLENMQNDSALSKIPVIVITQKNDEDDEIKALAMGATDYLLKPYRPAVIKQRIANTIKFHETSALVNAIKTDELTGIYNKNFFYDIVSRTIHNNPDKKYDIICSDVEKFKLVNDMFGYKKGDELLKYICQMFKKYSRGYGICGRIGVDIFAVLVEHRDSYNAEFFTDFIDEINCFSIGIPIKIYSGIYTVHNLSVPVPVMCDRAKLAAQSIKGRYDVYFAHYDDKIRQKMLFEQMITGCMRTAINEKQFKVYYQPKYDLSSERIAGAEALVRWVHPEKGFMSPSDFIPFFEKNGFISDMDFFVWETVCHDLREWIDDGNEPIPVSVNVSRADIYNPALPEILLNLTKKYSLVPAQIHLEITETAYTEDPAQIIEAASLLKKLGFIIEMDDFGSGYSSLNMLSELPIDILKLDVKFIQNESVKSNSKNILSFIMSLAKWMDLPVVAEGVETLDQVYTLKNMDCTYAQGFYYAKPMPVEDFKQLLNDDMKAAKNDSEESDIFGDDLYIIHRNEQHKEIMLIVEDSEHDRVVLSEMFKSHFTIVEAVDGASALAFIKKNSSKISIIMLNLVMPVMDGSQLFKQLKSDPTLSDIPVIIISQPKESDESKMLAMGADDFIFKPYNPQITNHRVNNAILNSKAKRIRKDS